MRVIFMGTPDFAQETLNQLIDSQHEVVLVVTQPDKPRGRGKEVSFSPVKEVAIRHGIEVFQPEKIKSEESVEYLKKYQADVIVVVAFGQILSKEILTMTKYGCVNVHGSLLPKYRGASPIQWAVLNGDPVTGVTTMRMDEGLDTGDIIMTSEVIPDPEETAGTLFDRLKVIGAQLLLDTLQALQEGTAIFTPQNPDLASHTRLISKDMGKIDFNRSAVELERFVRGMSPWPSAYTTLHGKTLKIWKSKALADHEALMSDSDKKARPGEIIKITKETMIVKVKDGAIELLEVQLEGKRRMSCEEFLRGYHPEVGMKLG